MQPWKSWPQRHTMQKITLIHPGKVRFNFLSFFPYKEIRIVAGLAQRNPTELRSTHSLSRCRRPPSATQLVAKLPPKLKQANTMAVSLTRRVEPRCRQTGGSEHSVFQPLYPVDHWPSPPQSSGSRQNSWSKSYFWDPHRNVLSI